MGESCPQWPVEAAIHRPRSRETQAQRWAICGGVRLSCVTRTPACPGDGLQTATYHPPRVLACDTPPWVGVQRD